MEAQYVHMTSVWWFATDVLSFRRALQRQSRAVVTTLQQVELHKKIKPLLAKITRFTELQATHMPSLATARPDVLSNAPVLTADTALTYPIVLPSSLPAATRAAVCSPELVTIEDDFRNADLFEALDDLRHALRMRSSYNRDKVKNITGQIRNTRAREKQLAVDEEVKDAAYRYRDARRSLMQLRGEGDWEKVLRPLLDSDIVGLNERALTREELAENERVRVMGGTASDDSVALTGAVYTGEGRRTLSWIWYAEGVDLSSADVDDPGLRDGESLRATHANS